MNDLFLVFKATIASLNQRKIDISLLYSAFPRAQDKFLLYRKGKSEVHSKDELKSLSDIQKILLPFVLLLTGCSYSASLQGDNDVFTLANEDRWYSHSTEIELAKDNHSFGIGQDIVTPDDKWEEELIEGDRPYAGYLYAFHSRKFLVDGLRTWQIRTEGGIIGPSARAEEVQDFVHDAIGDAKFRGWDNQLRDEPALNMYLRHTWHHWHDDPIGLDTFLEAAAGNVLVAGTAGTRLRWRFEHGNWWGLAFAGLEGQAKARDIYLDGNTWKESHSVDKHPTVATTLTGFCLGYDKAYFGYVFRVLSKEFVEQPAGHNFGSVRFGYGRQCE